MPLRAEPPLAGLTRAELLDVAGDAGIVGRHRLRKAELIDAIVQQRLEAARADTEASR